MSDPAPPRTTVVVITHNYGRYLLKAVTSVVEQTRPPRVLVMDDGSTDDTDTVVAELVTQHPGVQVCRFPTARGLTAVRNEAAKKVDTDWIVYLDADDWLSPHFVERGERYLDRHPDCDALTTDVTLLRDDEAPRVVRARVPRSWRRLVRRNTVFQTSFIRRSMILDLEGYDPAFAYEDWEFWIRALKAGYRLDRLPGAHVYRREHGLNHGAMADRTQATRAVQERHPVPSFWPWRR